MNGKSPKSPKGKLNVINHRDVTCGTNSNIPPCCIDWFINVWSERGIIEVGETKEGYKIIDHTNFGAAWFSVLELFPAEYVMCPSCVSCSNYVIIRDCELEGACSNPVCELYE